MEPARRLGGARPSATSWPGGSRSTSRPSTPSAATCSAPSRPGHRDRNEAARVLDTMHQAGADAARLLRTPATPDGHGRGPPPDLHGGGHRRRATAAAAQLDELWWDSWAERRAARPLRLPRLLVLLSASACAATARSAVAGGRHARPAGLRAAGPRASPTCSTACRPTTRTGRSSISEAGIGTDDDQQRNDYVEAVLDIARDAITGGVDLRGHLLVDRRRQLRVGPGLRRALRPLRPRPQPQARRRDRQAAAIG